MKTPTMILAYVNIGDLDVPDEASAALDLRMWVELQALPLEAVSELRSRHLLAGMELRALFPEQPIRDVIVDFPGQVVADRGDGEQAPGDSFVAFGLEGDLLQEHRNIGGAKHLKSVLLRRDAW